MRTLPHSSECGEFFLYLRPLCPNRQQGRRKTAQVREENPPLFAKTPLLSGKTCGLFATPRPLLTPPARHLPLSPRQRQDSPHLSGAKSEKNRPIVRPSRRFTTSRHRKPCFSDVSPHFKRLFGAHFSAKRLPFVPNRHFSVTLWQKSDRQRGASYKHSLSLLFEMCRLVVLLSSHLQKTAV